ncbi:MAG: amidophosphoribosyltransferase [Rickettsiales bacterium]|jgi:amidophosphoribosyltransferase|nr:amidophosphoribosyltransferase [Rickettsiales bacterium]
MSNRLPQISKLKEECGIMGVSNAKNACFATAIGLYALQHRGQESAGIIVQGPEKFHIRRGEGAVLNNFDLGRPDSMPAGRAAIGHVRYSTAGGPGAENIQPFTLNTDIGKIALAHNGNLTNAQTLKEELLAGGMPFVSNSDSEVALNLIASLNGEKDFPARLIKAFSRLVGAFSFLVMTDGKIAAVRDPRGMRPLVMGRKDGGFAFASETAALDMAGAEYVRDLDPGEIVIVETGVSGREPLSYSLPETAPERFCIFEYVYFMRSNSKIRGVHAAEFRKAVGRELAKEFEREADIIVPVPDSGVHAALGMAAQMNVPYEMGIVRGHYIQGRTFIAPTQEARCLKTALKLSVDRNYISGKRIALVDDSIVRGTTMKSIVRLLREADAKEIHVVSASPALSHPCFYGVDMQTYEELISHSHTPAEMAAFFNADSVQFVSVDGLYRGFLNASGRLGDRFTCDACMTGQYDTPIVDAALKARLLGRKR